MAKGLRYQPLVCDEFDRGRAKIPCRLKRGGDLCLFHLRVGGGTGSPITYSAAKAALHAMIRGLSWPLGKTGIRINGVAAGNILHETSVWAVKIKKERKKTEAWLKKEVSLQRLGRSQEIGDVVAFLASPRASFVSGAIWVVDGGQTRSK